MWAQHGAGAKGVALQALPPPAAAAARRCPAQARSQTKTLPLSATAQFCPALDACRLAQGRGRERPAPRGLSSFWADACLQGVIHAGPCLPWPRPAFSRPSSCELCSLWTGVTCGTHAPSRLTFMGSRSAKAIAPSRPESTQHPVTQVRSATLVIPGAVAQMSRHHTSTVLRHALMPLPNLPAERAGRLEGHAGLRRPAASHTAAPAQLRQVRPCRAACQCYDWLGNTVSGAAVLQG